MGKLVIFKLSMDALNKRDRTIRVLLPNQYELVNDYYPVLYMHDGQNLFDDQTASYGKSWGIKETLEQMNLPLIVVGIDNAASLSRLDEYSPYINYHIKYEMGDYVTRDVGGEGDPYGEFIINQLKPFIDAEYRTLKEPKNTYIAGSSMGGLISLYLGLKYQNVFGGVAAFSSALWFAENELIHFVETTKDQGLKKIYLDTGTNESSFDIEMNKIYVKTNQSMAKALQQVFGNSKIELVIEEGAKHNEAAWEKRFKAMIESLIG